MINREQRLARQSLVNFVKDESCQGEDAGDGVGGADTHDAVMRIQEKMVARETYTTDIGTPSKGGVYYCVQVWLLYREQKELVQRRQDEQLEQKPEVHLNQ